MKESSCEIISGTGRIGTTGGDRTYMMTLAALLHIRSVLAYFDDCYITLFGYHLHRLFRVEVRISERLIFVGKDDIHILFDQTFEEGMVFVNHIIGR